MPKSFKKYWKVIINHRLLIISSVIICALLGSLGRYIISANRQSMVLSLCYSGIDKGLNPDGSRFNIFELKSDEVLNNAIKKANIQGMTVDYLRNRIDIFSRVPSNATEKVKQANESGSSYSYIPNEYSISYSQKSKLSKNHTIIMLNALAESYEEYFKKNYTEKSTVLELDDLKDIGAYEYVEQADLYSNKITSMINYLQTHKDENNTYVSKKTTQSFGDLISRLRNLNNIDVERYRTYVINSGLVDNKELYIKKIQHSIDDKQIDYEKAMQSSDFTSGVISKYDPTITGVLYIPSVDSTKQFYMNRTQTGLDYLTKDAYNEGESAKKIKEGIDHDRYLLSIFTNSNPTDQEKAAGKTTAKKMLESIDEKLENISKTALITDKEYMEYKTSDYLKFSIPKSQFTSYLSLKIVLIYGFIGLIISLAYVFIKSFAKDFKQMVFEKHMSNLQWIRLKRRKNTKEGGDEK